MITGIPRWVDRTRAFQDYALVNKAVLECTGVDIPMIALARNRNERSETIFRQAVILTAAFVLAPLHAWLFSWGFSRLYHMPQGLMQLSFRSLRDVQQMAHGIAALPKKALHAQKLPPVNAALRQNLIKAKTDLLTYDLIIEGLIFSNLGWIKNWFGRMLTGKRQFTGEMGVVSQAKLDQLYRERQKHQKPVLSEKYLPLLTSGLAVVVSLALGYTLRWAMLHPKRGGSLLASLRQKSHWFDYKKGYLLPLVPLFIIGVLNDFGDIMAARSTHERREMFLKKVPITATFFFGDFFWMWLITQLFGKRLGLQAQSSIQKAMANVPKPMAAKAARYAAGFYWLSFVLNTLTVAGVILGNNQWTTQKVQAEARHLENTPQDTPGPGYRTPIRSDNPTTPATSSQLSRRHNIASMRPAPSVQT